MDQRVKAELEMLKNTIIETLPVKKIILFGSFAYGTPHKDSDIDLYIVLKEGVEMKEMDATDMLWHTISNNKTMPLDLIVARYSVYERRKTWPSIERHITNNGVVIYDAVP
jgi:predicted nucleotidyltransferase